MTILGALLKEAPILYREYTKPGIKDMFPGSLYAFN
jgi:hypothetical protein